MVMVLNPPGVEENLVSIPLPRRTKVTRVLSIRCSCPRLAPLPVFTDNFSFQGEPGDVGPQGETGVDGAPGLKVISLSSAQYLKGPN